MSNLLNLRIAAFGESRSGKTVLLSTFYGRMRSASFIKSRGYSLVANSRAQGNRLLELYHQLESKKFPPASLEHTLYAFSLMVNRLNQVALNIEWDDYPGEWWTTDAVDAEYDHERETLPWNLLHSDAALFIVDGERYKEGGHHYLLKLFGKFREEFERQRIKMELEEDAPAPGVMPWPKTWIIALSKCDIFPQTYTAEKFYKDIVSHQDIIEEIDLMKEKLSFQDANSTFGERFLLLSAVSVQEGVPVVSTGKGLDLIPALLFKASLEDLKNKYRQNAKRQPPNVTKWIESNLPLFGRFLGVNRFNESIRQQAEADKQSADVLSEGINLISIPLAGQEGETLYYESI